MSQAHKGSRIIRQGALHSVDSSTSFLAHFDITENDVLRGIAPLQNIATLREGKFGGGIAIEEATTNLIPGGAKNMHPSTGNTYGTFNTNRYNNNTFFSIGTIVSVVDNVITYNPAGATILRTYDALSPQSTGGGVVAGTTYFVKAISDTQFSLHAYNSSQDGSQGFAVHNSIKNNIKIPVNATNFPTYWIGLPHLPNSGLVKEIIPNGFNLGGRMHDCLRLYTDFRTDGVYDRLAYGVKPFQDAGVDYAYSFYHKASSASAVGKTVTFSLHNKIEYFSNSSFILDANWQRHTVKVNSAVSEYVDMYWNAGAGIAWDIAEIQCEQKSYATSFCETSRVSGTLTYPISILNKSEGTMSFWAKLPYSLPFIVPLETMYMTTGPGYGGSNSLNFMAQNSLYNNRIIGIHWSDTLGGTNHLALDTSQVTNYNNGDWNMFTITWKDIDGYKVYINGKFYAQSAVGKTLKPFGSDVLTIRGMMVDELRIDSVVRNEEEIMSWHISECPFFPRGVYSIAY